MDREEKRHLKQQTRDHERKAFIEGMPITLVQAKSLVDALDCTLEATACDHTHRLTRGWCQANGYDAEQVVDWATRHGGYCDCEVAANLADPIEDAEQLGR